MLYSFYNLDVPGSTIRRDLLLAHREYLAKFADRFAFAGPLLDDDGDTPVGSLLVLDFDSRESAHAFIGQEPYFVAGLYESVSIRPFANFWEQRRGFPQNR